LANFAWSLSLLLAWLPAQVAAAAAASSSSVDLQLFLPSPSGKNFITVESGEIVPHLSLSSGLYLSWGHNLLQVEAVSADRSQAVVGSIVANRVDANLFASLGLYNYGELGLLVPLTYQNGFDQQSFISAGINLGASNIRPTTLGDLRVVPKLKLYDHAEGLFAAALLPEFTLPTARQAAYIGERGLTFSPMLALSSRVSLFRFGLNFGYRLRKPVTVSTVELGNEYLVKLAAAVDLSFGGPVPIELLGEVFGYTPGNQPFGFGSKGMDKTFSRAATPFEGNVGLRARFEPVVLSIGGGGGLLPGYGAPVPRLYVGAMFYTGRTLLADADNDGIPDGLDACPDKAEDKDGFEDGDGCPDLDNDKDGILDEDDQCPNEAEDKDGFQDEDGCPDLDNDKDGVPDAQDKCPNEPEDKDGFQDEDGCPDPDNDKDGIPDAQDKCPNQAEDIDGFQDEDGCPDPDNDGDGLPDLNDLCPNYPEDKDGYKDDDGCPDDNDNDGIADAQDKCPNEPETYNGYKDDDGCPDSAGEKQLVQVVDDKIEIKEKVYFRAGSATIEPRSHALLGQVAAVLHNFVTITLVRIEGHTDNGGARAANVKLSATRAAAVRTYLIAKGVDAKRLEAKGFGPDKPLGSNKTAVGREKNRRVEFVIVTQRPIGQEVKGKAFEAPQIKVELPAAPTAPAGAQGPEPEAAEPSAPSEAPAAPLLDLGSTPASPPAGKKPKAPAKAKKTKADGNIDFNF
jgi:outer membrane protein OmpA-like peptidoglycan-associated protein